MATRYSGDLTIRVQWIDKAHTGPHGGYYRCTISRGKTHLWSGAINAAQHITDGVDSPASYDSTARAALAFAGHEGADVESAAYSDSGPWVGRSKKTAWPNEPSQRNMSGRAQRRPNRKYGYAPSWKETTETDFDMRHPRSFDQYKAMVRADLERIYRLPKAQIDHRFKQLTTWLKAAFGASHGPAQASYQMAHWPAPRGGW